MADLIARIKPKKSSTPGEIPSAGDLEVSELAVNTADGKLFTKHTDNSIVTIAGGGGGGNLEVVYAQDGILMDFDGGNGSTTFTESTGKITSWTLNGSAQQTTTQVKYGTSAFLGESSTANWIRSNNLLGTAVEDELAVGLGDFTLETWIYLPTGCTTSWQNVVHIGDTTGNFGLYSISVRKEGSGLNDGLVCKVGNGNDAGFTAFNLQNQDLYNYDTWHHLTVCRSGGTVKAFVDGTQVGSSYDGSAINVGSLYAQANLHFTIGRTYDSEILDSHLDNMYFVPQAKYTTTFTPAQATVLDAVPSNGDIIAYNGQWEVLTPTLGSSSDVRAPIANAYTLTNKVANYTAVVANGDWSSDVWGGGPGGFLVSWEKNTADAAVLDAIIANDVVTFYWPDGSVSTETISQRYDSQANNNAIVVLSPHSSNWSGHANGTALTIQCASRITGTALAPSDGQVLTWVEAEGEWQPVNTTVSLDEVGSVDIVPAPTIYQYNTYSALLNTAGQWADDAGGLYVHKTDSNARSITTDPSYGNTAFWYSTDNANWVAGNGAFTINAAFVKWSIGDPGLVNSGTLYVSYSNPSLSVQDGQVLGYVAANSQWEAIDVVASNTTIGGAGSGAVSNIVTISQANYDALGTPDANTIYFIV